MINFLGKNKIYTSSILHQVTAGQTITDIAQKYHANLELLQHNPTKDLYEGQCIFISGLDKKYHIVKPTETIISIAKKYNISPQDIMQKNNIKQIFIGQMLEI